MKNKVEILSPVGSFEALERAIDNGADAVYLAGKSFGARAYADNFTNEEIKEAIEYAHSYGVKVYITVNTLIYECEIEKVIDFIDYIYINNVDAIILQDLGLASIVKDRYPNLDMHASTQMNIHTLEQVKTIEEFGFKRVVLGREVTLSEIKIIRENSNIEIEVFVHGALCISYSGNCYMSSLIGKRSGNRGKCAQPCRMEYTYNGKTKYYFSTKDLCTTEFIKDIIPYVDSLKIEGRMKSSGYVGVVTNNYCKLVNNILNNKTSNFNEINSELKTVFNREFTKGYINSEHKHLITNVNSQNHIGSLIGEVVSTDSNGFTSIKIFSKLYKNDCLRIVDKNDTITKDAVIVNEIYLGKNLVKEANKGTIVRIKTHKKLKVSDKVYITKSLVLENKYNKKRRVFINGKCYLSKNYLILEVTDGINKVVKKLVVEHSENDMSQRIKEQLLKTKETIFEFKSIEITDIYCFTQIKNINSLRREALDELYKVRLNRPKRKIKDYDDFIVCTDKVNDIININNINIVVSNIEQYEAILSSDITNYNLFVRGYDLYSKLKNNENCYFYAPRIGSNLSENAIISNYQNIKNNIISPYLNVTNAFAINAFERLGASLIGLSIELSKDNIIDIVDNYNDIFKKNPNVYIMIYGYYQAMIMKHCFINKEFNCKKEDCKICSGDVKIIDRVGKEYPVIRDENCNSVILYHTPVNLINEIDEIKSIGINKFMIDFTIEKSEEVLDVLNMFKTRIIDKKCYKGHYYNNDL